MTFQTIERYEFNGLGLPYPVIILNGAQHLLNEKGEEIAIHIPDQEALAASVALCRVMAPIELAGSEVRFIRRVLGMTAKDFAAALAMDASTLSRWENDKVSVGQWADKQVRMAAVIALRDKVPHAPVDHNSVITMQPVRRMGDCKTEITVRRQPVSCECRENEEAGEWGVASMPLAA